MRLQTHILSLLFLLCCDANIYGQVVHAIQPGFYTYGGDLQHLPDGRVRLIGMSVNNWGTGDAAISNTILSNTGEILSVTVFPELGFETGWEFLTLPMRDGTTIISADLTGCDYPIPFTMGRISSGDDVEWAIQPIEKVGSHSNLIGMWQVSDSSYVVITEDSTVHYSFNGIRLSAIGAFIQYQQMMLVAQGYLLGFDSTFAILDDAFQSTKEIVFNSRVQSFDTIGHRGYLVATADSLFVLDEDLNILRQSSNPSLSSYFTFATSRHYWIHDLATNTFQKLDTFFTPLESFPVPGMKVTDVLHLGDRIFIAADNITNIQSSICIYTSADAFSLAMPDDIGISEIRTTSQAYSWVAHEIGSGLFYNVSYGPVYVTLTNYGTTEISQASVRFREDACHFCSEELQREWDFSGLSISPGSSSEVYLGKLFFNCVNYDLTQLCLYTVNPNNAPDGNASNDSHCTQVDVIAGTEEATNDFTEVHIYPNPASEVLYVEYDIESESIAGNISLVDYQGKTVLQTPLFASGNRIYLHRITPGIYSVLVQTSKGKSVVKRVVVI